MTGRKLFLVMATASLLAAGASCCSAQDATGMPATTVTSAPEDLLVLLSVDVRTLPGVRAKQSEPDPPKWRTSFGSERRSEPEKPKSSSSVDADIVLLQGVTDVPTLRRWFPAGQWRLVVSRQIYAAASSDEPTSSAADRAPVPTTAVAVRLRRGLRVTGQDHLLELADALGKGPSDVTAAGTAVRILLDGRQTWALSVLLPENCGDDCPGRVALERWHQDREREEVRRVTGGRFERSQPNVGSCASFGLRLDPPPPPPRQVYTAASQTPLLGCAASVSVAK
jgi:hypothetical protein